MCTSVCAPTPNLISYTCSKKKSSEGLRLCVRVLRQNWEINRGNIQTYNYLLKSPLGRMSLTSNILEEYYLVVTYLAV